MSDDDLLGSCPDYISIGAMFKATPHTEGDQRFVFFEASNEGLDQQGEVIVAKALRDSSDFFLKYGNIDIDHITKIGPKLGIPDYQKFEIGQPVEVRQDGGSTSVKAEIFSGDGPAAEKANLFWSSVYDLKPAARWYPSVGGQALQKAIEVDPDTHQRRAIIKQVRSSKIGVSKTPVNQHVGACATIPVGAFAKSFGPGGLDIAKALESGYGTDSSLLDGGAALRKQSLSKRPANYFDFRNQLAKAMRSGDCGKSPLASDLVRHANEKFGMSPDKSSEHVERFMRDIHTSIRTRSAA